MRERQELFSEYLTRHLVNAGGTSRSHERRKSILFHNYGRILPKDKSGRIMEIGPGFGELLELLRGELGYQQVTAVDISEEVVENCNKLFPGSTIHVRDTCEYFAAHPGEFDCVFMLHVLEHIPKVETIHLLEMIRNALAPEGRLVVEVPNMSNPFTGPAMRYGDFTHEVGYTELSLAYVLKMAGFSKVELSGVKLPLDRFTRVLQRMVYVAVNLALYPIYSAYRVPGKPILSVALYGIAAK
jgi:2-polyprenyl-3-methyl-5-hydroxy-6-metoxy-1,4-benzoquinol methylase